MDTAAATKAQTSRILAIGGGGAGSGELRKAATLAIVRDGERAEARAWPADPYGRTQAEAILGRQPETSADLLLKADRADLSMAGPDAALAKLHAVVGELRAARKDGWEDVVADARAEKAQRDEAERRAQVQEEPMAGMPHGSTAEVLAADELVQRLTRDLKAGRIRRQPGERDMVESMGRYAFAHYRPAAPGYSDVLGLFHERVLPRRTGWRRTASICNRTNGFKGLLTSP